MPERKEWTVESWETPFGILLAAAESAVVADDGRGEGMERSGGGEDYHGRGRKGLTGQSGDGVAFLCRLRRPRIRGRDPAVHGSKLITDSYDWIGVDSRARHDRLVVGRLTRAAGWANPDWSPEQRGLFAGDGAIRDEMGGVMKAKQYGGKPGGGSGTSGGARGHLVLRQPRGPRLHKLVTSTAS